MRAPAIALPTPIPAAAPGAIECLDGALVGFVVWLVVLDMGVEDRTVLVV